jgi:plastocyanin
MKAYDHTNTHRAMKHILAILILLLGATMTLAQRTYTLSVDNDAFFPEFLVVEAGDPIELRLTGDHTLTEVDAGTFRSGGTVPNGGIRIGRGIGYGFTGVDSDETTFTLHDPGNYYFVSEGRNGSVAKARIVVIASTHTGFSEAVDQFRPVVFPNPADDHVRFAAHEHLDMMSVEVYDQSGRLVHSAVVRGSEPMYVTKLPSGLYTLRLTDGMSAVYGVERLVINRK